MNFIKQIPAVSREFHKAPFAGEAGERQGRRSPSFAMSYFIPSSFRSSAAGQRSKKTAFTLLELLVVMAIIAVMLVVALPAIRGLNGGASRRAAIGQLMGVLDRARMMAISDNKATYVVMVGAIKDGTCPAGLVKLQGRAYAIFEDADNLSNPSVQRTTWMYLPTGVSFKVDKGNDVTTSVMNYSPDDPPQFALRNPTSGGGIIKSTLPYFRFDSTGMMEQRDKPADLRLLLFQGSLNEQGVEMATQRISGTADEQKVLLDEINLNQITGRAKYVLNPADNLSSSQAAAQPN